MLYMCFRKTRDKTQKIKVDENGNLFYFRLLKTPFFAEARKRKLFIMG